MSKFVFVILHYLTTRDTMEAVSSIKQYAPDAQIVIVDNASGNGSLEQLQDAYADDARVDVITAKENLGFARGNNLGIAYARERYAPDFICLMNNDILLLENPLPPIEQEYAASHFAVLGPMVYTADGRCNDNPGTATPMTEQDLHSLIRYLERMIRVNHWHLWLPYRAAQKIWHRLHTPAAASPVTHRNYLQRQENVQLHGSFLVLSPKFFAHFNGLFDGTFLNLEEDILFWQLRQAGQKTVYLPSLHVFHKEDAASKQVWPNERKRALAKMENILFSARAFQRLRQEQG